MQNQHDIPILIFAQSGRFLAQSATQAGYRVWVADCFGDTDLLAVTERWTLLEPISTLTSSQIIHLLSTLSRGEECQLICGSGIESVYRFLNELPSNIHLIGNTAKTIKQLRSPSLFFPLLDKLTLPYPETVLQHDQKKSGYLVKSESGMGGIHIQYLDYETDVKADHYFQQFISGNSGSILFLANGLHAQQISINELTYSSTASHPFQLDAIHTPWSISEEYQSNLAYAVNAITKETKLMGLNSLDFIISDHSELLLLEVNPRFSASAELIDNYGALFECHINACQGILPTTSITHHPASLKTIYASNDIVIPQDMDWPSNCSDLSPEGTFIAKNTPLCTSLIHEISSRYHEEPHSQTEQHIMKQLQPVCL